MPPLFEYDGQENHYKNMLELQEKLRKSEEERVRLEERLNILVRESRTRHESCMKRLRLRYDEFLQGQRARDERNSGLLNKLHNIDLSLGLMTAKTDRLRFLRKQYVRFTSSYLSDSGVYSPNCDSTLPLPRYTPIQSADEEFELERHIDRIKRLHHEFLNPSEPEQNTTAGCIEDDYDDSVDIDSWMPDNNNAIKEEETTLFRGKTRLESIDEEEQFQDEENKEKLYLESDDSDGQIERHQASTSEADFEFS